jgi:hypothetical protein
MGRLAVTEELHAKQEAARKEAERAGARGMCLTLFCSSKWKGNETAKTLPPYAFL